MKYLLIELKVGKVILDKDSWWFLIPKSSITDALGHYSAGIWNPKCQYLMTWEWDSATNYLSPYSPSFPLIR